MNGEDTPQQHTHCWHTETVVTFVVPAQVTQVCCHCGERQAITAMVDVSEHGPYLPAKSVVIRGVQRSA